MPLCGQKLYLSVAPDEAPFFEKNIREAAPIQPGTYLLEAADSFALAETCRSVLRRLREQSYLSASIDDWQQTDPAVSTARLHLGPEMRWVQLRPSAASEAWLDAAGFGAQLFTGKPLRPEALLRLEQAVLEQAENNGFPFAAVWLDSIRFDSHGGVSAVLQVERHSFFTFKNIKIVGDVRLPASFLPQYLGIRPGMPYSRAKVLRLRDQLRTLLFLETTANPSITFAGNEATVNLFLQKKRASRFDFIVGLLPQPNSTDGRLLLTGTLNAAFLHALNLGEHFAVALERLRPETQKLDVQAGVPYCFGLPFGVEGQLNVFRRDSTWVDATGQLGVQYLLTGNDFVQFFWENKSSSLQKVDTARVKSTRRLPPNLDFRQNGFGLEAAFERLDYRFNPRQGWLIHLRAVAGFNNIRPNNQIEALRDPEDPDFRYASLYDSVRAQSTRFRLEGRGEWYVPLFARGALKVAARSGSIISDKPVYLNEQYRLGGNKLLRGFNEESLVATRYAVATLELRLLLGQNSFLSAFTDYGYIENITDQARVFLRPWGMGAGMNFETQAGIFGISLAVGRQDAGQGVDFKSAKFHLGYVSLF